MFISTKRVRGALGLHLIIGGLQKSRCGSSCGSMWPSPWALPFASLLGRVWDRKNALLQREAFCSSIIFPSEFSSRDRLNFYGNQNKIKSGCSSGQSSQIDCILIKIIFVYRLNDLSFIKRLKGSLCDVT